MEQTEEVEEVQEQIVTARDMLNRPIEAGAVITYPGRYSSSMWMNVGVVRGMALEYSRTYYRKMVPTLQVERLEVNSDYDRKLGRSHARLARRMVRVDALDRVLLLGITEEALVRTLEQRADYEQEQIEERYRNRSNAQ